MKTLVIETASEACSLALFDGADLQAASHAVLGRGHAERLVPEIAALPGKGRADRIAVSLGPGSFTGTRIGLAAARALGVAWNVPVIGYPTLALVAATARMARPGEPVCVAMTGGHGEIFTQDFGAEGLPVTVHRSLKPENAAKSARADLVAGSKAHDVVALRERGEAFETLPDARNFVAIPEELLTDRLTLIYGRPPDAKTPV